MGLLDVRAHTLKPWMKQSRSVFFLMAETWCCEEQRDVVRFCSSWAQGQGCCWVWAPGPAAGLGRRIFLCEHVGDSPLSRANARVDELF